jgi:predicted nucleic acid-binding protein
MHYPFEVKPQESCLTQLYAFPGGSQQELELCRGGRQSPMSMKGRSQCVVACLFPITVLLSQAENYPNLEMFMSATCYVITSLPSVVCEPIRSIPRCRYLLDTCIVVDYVEQNLDIPRALLDECAISVITIIELLLPRKRSAITVYRLGEFLTSRPNLPCDWSCVKVAVMLRFKMKLTVPDAIIAATSVCNGLTLVTADKRLLNHPAVNCTRLEDIAE